MFAQGGGLGRKGSEPLLVEGLQDGGTALLPVSYPSSGPRVAGESEGTWEAGGGAAVSPGVASRSEGPTPTPPLLCGARFSLPLPLPSLCLSLFRFQPQNS